MRITISGQPGAGSTTIASLLAKKLKYRQLLMGELHKKIAKAHKMTIKEYWEHQEQNPKEQRRFHNELDALQKQEAKKNRNIVINGKLSAFQIPNAEIKVLLKASLLERAKRTVERDGGNIISAAWNIFQREQMERNEFRKIYGFDYVADKKYYNVIINTDDKKPNEIAEIILKQMKKVK